MRSARILAVSTLSLLILLTSCTFDSHAHIAERVPECYSNASGFTAQVRTRVNRGSSENEFTLDWEHGSDGSEIRITAPESVAGVRAGFTPDARTVEYAGEALVIPESISPVEALPMLAQCWTAPASEYSGGSDRVQFVWFDTLGENALEFRTVFDSATLYPIEAEAYVNGSRMATFVFDSFAFFVD